MDTNERKRIQQTRYLIFVPILITVICAWLDIWCTYSSGAYDQMDIESRFVSITRCIYGYFFPSFISLIIPLLIQQLLSDEKQYGIPKKKVSKTILFLVLYCVIYITCLINFYIFTSCVFLASSVIYIVVTWVYSLDTRIKHLPKDDMDFEIEETNKLAMYISKESNSGEGR